MELGKLFDLRKSLAGFHDDPGTSTTSSRSVRQLLVLDSSGLVLCWILLYVEYMFFLFNSVQL